MAHEREDQPIIIYPDKGKILKANETTFLLVGGLALLAFALWSSVRGVERTLIMFSRASLLAWDGFASLHSPSYSFQSQL